MNIAFVGNHYKTYIYQEIARELEKKGHKVFWIVPSSTLMRWLVERGVASQVILDVSSGGEVWSTNLSPLSTEERNNIAVFEKLSPITFNNIVLMDRHLCLQNPNYALRYLLVCANQLKEFLSKSAINFIFCEQTVGLELVCGLVANNLGKRCLRPHIVRIPDERLAFFECPFEETIVARSLNAVKHSEAVASAEAYYSDFVTKKPKPAFFYKNNSIPTVQFNWLSKTIKHISLLKGDKYDETRYKLSWLLLNRPREAINAFAATKLKFFKKIELPYCQPFVLFALHKQPEYSIDVLGSYYSDQLETIRLLSKSIPSSHVLFVKEHSNAIGDRSYKFYREARKLPNVVLADPYLDSHELIQHADLVLSVSGTIAYEASLLGKRAATFSKMFFGPLLQANGIDMRSDGYNTICELLNTPVVDPREKAVSYFTWLFKNSFSGIFGDPVTNQLVLENGNIFRIATAFDEILSTQ